MKYFNKPNIFILIMFILCYLGVIALILTNNVFDILSICLITIIIFLIVSIFYKEQKS